MTSIQRFAQITAAFDPEATRVLEQAFDMACALLGRSPSRQRCARPSPNDHRSREGR